MTNQSNPAFPVVKQPSSEAGRLSAHNGAAPRQRSSTLALALCLSIIPALVIGATTYHWVGKVVIQEISQTQSGKTSIAPALHKQLLLILTLSTGLTALLVSAIALIAHRHSLRSSKFYSEKALLFGDIASQSQPVDLNYLYKRAVEGAREVLQADRVMIYTFDADWRGTIIAESVAPGWVQSLGNEIVDTCMQESKVGLYKNGRVCVINDIYKAGLSGCHIKLLEKYQIKANMVVPILKDDQLLGLLLAQQCEQPRVWQLDEIDFFVQLATLISLRTGGLNYLEQRAKAGQADSFSKVALRIRQSLDPEEVFNTATKEIRQTLNVERVVVCRLDASLQDGTVIAESVVSGWPTLLGLQLHQVGLGDDYLEMFKNGYVHAISNILQESALNNSDSPLSEPYQIKASLVAPIRTGNQLVGLIIAHQYCATQTWEQSMLSLFEELAAQVGLALEQATLLKSAATEAKRTQLLAEFTAYIRQSLNSQDIFSTSVQKIRQTLESDRVLIYRFHPDGTSGEITSQAVALDWAPAPEENLNKLFKEENYQGYKTGSLWVAHDVYQADLTPSHLRRLEDLQIKASMVAPILVDDQLVGLLCAHQCCDRRDWKQPEFYLLKQLAAQIGFALEQAKLIEQVNIASRMQQQQTEELRRQLVSLIEDVEGAAQGDLTIRADVSEGEIGTVADFFNVVIESLRGIVRQVKLATTQVNASLGDNQEAIRQLSFLSLKQAQETTRTLDSVEQMTHSIQQVADSANLATDVARTASATAQAGEEAMDRTVQTILNLQETVAQTANKVKHLGESSQQISKVVALINQIALQTNLLAINAGIEAARAGAERQSFAVVAKEVAELADRSAAATKEIEQIVENIQFETSQVVEAMEVGTTQVVEGTHLVEDAKQSLSRILEVSRQIDQLVASISVAAVSQAQTSQAVTDLMKEMVQVSEQTSTSSQEISGSLQQTVAVAQQLQASVEVFKVDEWRDSEEI
jgi:methyl-accepting chemotaxis protein PixJ